MGYSCFVISTFFIIGFTLILTPPIESRDLIGSSRCTWGPSYWCYNITNAKGCGAVKHCIQTVWEKQEGEIDNDSICKICLDMVKQARDQLESNETQSDIKDVFEGSCKLIPIKPVKKECIKFVDNFAPELVDALASQMNPQVVCSVAGLCNNAEIDKLLEEFERNKPTEEEKNLPEVKIQNEGSLSCNDCENVANKIVEKFHNTDRDDILENMLHTCGLFSSFSDACSSIVIRHFDQIYSQIEKDISVKNICHLSGTCATDYYHQHEPSPVSIDIRPMSSVGVVEHKGIPSNEKTQVQDDDLTCELCEQLVKHLRDVMIANTTESEFKTMLEGICKQTKGFKDECLSIVEQYYDVIYNTLVNNLDPNGVCFMAGICKKGAKALNFEKSPIMPLLPQSDVSLTKKIVLGKNEPLYSAQQIQDMQLPIDKLMGAPNPSGLVENGQLCTLCEYFLHFVQEALATPSNEDKIKEVVESTCERLPAAVRSQCHDFVKMYGDAVIALLIQDIDPSQVCPKLKICPPNKLNKDMEVFSLPPPKEIEINIESNNKPTCPLCLFAVTEAQQLIKDDKTEERAKQVLDNLCTHFNSKLKEECIDFVNTYSKQLIEKLISNYTPQQICEYVKLCDEPKESAEISIHLQKDTSEREILTNEIYDQTINGVDLRNNYKYDSNIECLLCKKIVAKTENKFLNKNKTKEEIIDALEETCKLVHQIKNKCHSYVQKYGDKIAELMLAGIAPEQICSELMLCHFQSEFNDDLDNLNVEIIETEINPEIEVENYHSSEESDSDDLEIELGGGQQCVLCEFIMARLENELKNKKNEEEIKHTVHNICKKMPKTIAENCDQFVDKYGDLIIALVDSMPPKEICTRMNLCTKSKLSTSALKEFHINANEEIEECGVCHGAILNLYPIFKENPQIQDDEDLIFNACNELPSKYHGKCSDLIAYYGESILNLLKRNTDLSKICQNIGKCFINELPEQSYKKITKDEVKKIKNYRKKRSTNDNQTKPKPVGANKCTWGPGYWCQAKENADECNTTAWCIEKKQGFAAV